jgi:hypothetical protein
MRSIVIFAAMAALLFSAAPAFAQEVADDVVFYPGDCDDVTIACVDMHDEFVQNGDVYQTIIEDSFAALEQAGHIFKFDEKIGTIEKPISLDEAIADMQDDLHTMWMAQRG